MPTMRHSLALLLLAAGSPALAAETPVLDLKCTLDPAGSKMRIEAAVQLVSSKTALKHVQFGLSDQMEVPKVRILEPQDLAGDVVPTQPYPMDHDLIYTIALPKELPAGRLLKLRFEYAAKGRKGFVYLLSPEACLGGGYNTCWYPAVGTARRMLGAMEFHSPAGFIVKASGKELDAKESNGERVTRFQIIEPTVPTFAAARYVVHRVPGKVPVSLYLLRDRPVAKEYAEGCSKILEVLTKEFGPYPFPDFSIIETPSPVSSSELGFSGASFEGFMFADSDSVDGGFNLAYFGHEMGHQWWGNLVQTSGDKGAYMLSEGMAQYGSLQCVSALGAPGMAARYRFSGYPGYSEMQCGYGAILYGATEADRPMSQMPVGYDLVYHELANSKGFLVWDAIARQVGRERFRKALHSVTTKYAWDAVTYDQFLNAIRAQADKNVDPILSQWLDRKGAPTLWPEWTQSGRTLDLTVHQTAPAYVLELPVAVEFADGSRMVKRLACSSEKQVFRIQASGQVVRVEIDPHWEVFHSTPALQEEAAALRYYTEALCARQRGKVAEAEASLKAGLQNIPSPDKYAAEFMMHLGLASIYRVTFRATEAAKEVDEAVRCPTRNPRYLALLYYRRALALAVAKDLKGADAALRNAEAVEAGLPYPYLADSLARLRASMK